MRRVVVSWPTCPGPWKALEKKNQKKNTMVVEKGCLMCKLLYISCIGLHLIEFYLYWLVGKGETPQAENYGELQASSRAELGVASLHGFDDLDFLHDPSK